MLSLQALFNKIGVEASPDLIARVKELSRERELKKGDSFPIPAGTFIAILDGIIEVGGELNCVGDVIYCEDTIDLKCISSSCVLLEIDKEGLSIFPPQVRDRLIRFAKVVRSEEYVPVKLFVKRIPITLSPDAYLVEAARLMYEKGVSSVILVDSEDRPVGIVTDTDLRKALALGIDPKTKLCDIASRYVFTAQEDEPLNVALERMLVHGVKHLVIVDSHGKVSGMVTARDLLDAFTAVPLVLLRELQRDSTSDEVKTTYSRIIKQVINVAKERSVDVLEFSRIFSMAKILLLRKLLEIECKPVHDSLCVFIELPLATYSHVIGEPVRVHVVGDEKQISDYVLKLRTEISRMPDVSETMSIETYSWQDLESNIDLLTYVEVFSRHLWGKCPTIVIDDEKYANIMKKLAKLCAEIEIPLDIFGKLKVKNIDIARHIVLPLERMLAMLHYTCLGSKMRARPHRVISMLHERGHLTEEIVSDLLFIYYEMKNLLIRTCVRNYLERGEVSSEVNVDEIPEPELDLIRRGLRILKELKERTLSTITKYVVV